MRLLLILALLAPPVLAADDIRQETYAECIIRLLQRVSDGPDPVGTRAQAVKECKRLTIAKPDVWQRDVVEFRADTPVEDDGACDNISDCYNGAMQFCMMYHGAEPSAMMFVEGSKPNEDGPIRIGHCSTTCRNAGSFTVACNQGGNPNPIDCLDPDHPPAWDEECGPCFIGPYPDPDQCEDGPRA